MLKRQPLTPSNVSLTAIAERGPTDARRLSMYMLKIVEVLAESDKGFEDQRAGG